jgi:hypothetical protein
MASDAGTPIDRILISNPQFVRRIKIVSSAKRIIRQRLDGLFGITERVLFPDPDGLGRYIARWYSGGDDAAADADKDATRNAPAKPIAAANPKKSIAKAQHVQAATKVALKKAAAHRKKCSS